ncbi:Multidrug resistance-associated protein 7, partial [Cichlidogyrus casuarinus]
MLAQITGLIFMPPPWKSHKNFLYTPQIKVDGRDVRTLPLDLLRRRIITVTQDCFLFSGSIRQNLDPHRRHSDEELLQVLDRLKLSLDLEQSVAESGSNLSVGEKQLFTFARVYLQLKFEQRSQDGRGLILCLDEATAHLDPQKEQLVE